VRAILHRRAVWRTLRRTPLPIAITELACQTSAKAIRAAEVLAVSREVAAVELADRVRVIAITILEAARERWHPHISRGAHVASCGQAHISSVSVHVARWLFRASTPQIRGRMHVHIFIVAHLFYRDVMIRRVIRVPLFVMLAAHLAVWQRHHIARTGEGRGEQHCR
jgi:hypothetical protein